MQREDLPRALEIYARARALMRESGNPDQWGDDRPKIEKTIDDIQNKTGYALVDEEGEIVAVFAFLTGEDPTYRIIEGKWQNDAPYGTLHRVASSGKRKGVLKEILAFCEAQTGNVRVDTHRDNKIMQHLLEKSGYEYCGIIHIADGSPRLAYQKTLKKN